MEGYISLWRHVNCHLIIREMLLGDFTDDVRALQQTDEELQPKAH
jgi:hypothetical protein